MTALDDRRKKAKAERERTRRLREAAPESEMETGCAGVLDGRDISALNTTLRDRGVSDNDRHEILKVASLLAATEDKP